METVQRRMGESVEGELVPHGGDPLEDPEAFEARERALAERGALRRMPYDPRVAAIIIGRVAAGQTLKKVCDDCGISFGTIHKWKRSGAHAKEFREALKEAEELGAQYMVEEAIELADAPMSFPVDGMRAKLQVDSRWKLAEKHAPERYGKKADEGGGLDWGKVLDAMNGQKVERVAGAGGPETKGVDPI